MEVSPRRPFTCAHPVIPRDNDGACCTSRNLPRIWLQNRDVPDVDQPDSCLPRITFKNCGNSSRLNLRNTAPIIVQRGSFLVVQSVSLSVLLLHCMVRNFSSVKGFPYRPMRSLTKQDGTARTKFHQGGDRNKKRTQYDQTHTGRNQSKVPFTTVYAKLSTGDIARFIICNRPAWKSLLPNDNRGPRSNTARIGFPRSSKLSIAAERFGYE